jgi:GT2 family glycosyltransferase
MSINSKLTVVTVTYGNRWHLLQKVLREVLAQGVREVVLVDNAAILPTDELAAEFGNFVKIVHLPHNSGSAVGFKTGIMHALEAGAEYVLMLDDDNVPAHGSVAKLTGALSDLDHQCRGPVAVLGNRTHTNSAMTGDLTAKKVYLRPASFMGFHIFDIPFKLFKRIRKWASIPKNQDIPPLLNVDVCTYGGLMFHRSLIEKVGLPREDFVLYMDDYELTYRITASGGSIFLVTDANINDLEIQWNTGERFTNTFKAWLLGEGEIRAYYTARNLCYFETNLQHHSGWLRWVNKAFYLVILNYFAWRLGKYDRLSQLHKAICDGESGKMGINPEFLL